MSIIWTNELALGIPEIDHQRKEFVDRVNRFISAQHNGEATKELTGMVKFLEAYTIVNTNAEQELMQAHYYPIMQAHLDEHNSFRKKVAFLRKQFDGGADSEIIFSSTRKVCMAWFTNHINITDPSLGRYLKARGVGDTKPERRPGLFARAR